MSSCSVVDLLFFSFLNGDSTGKEKASGKYKKKGSLGRKSPFRTPEQKGDNSRTRRHGSGKIANLVVWVSGQSFQRKFREQNINYIAQRSSGLTLFFYPPVSPRDYGRSFYRSPWLITAGEFAYPPPASALGFFWNAGRSHGSGSRGRISYAPLPEPRRRRRRRRALSSFGEI